jgi:hypothetical protein
VGFFILSPSIYIFKGRHEYILVGPETEDSPVCLNFIARMYKWVLCVECYKILGCAEEDVPLDSRPSWTLLKITLEASDNENDSPDPELMQRLLVIIISMLFNHIWRNTLASIGCL